LAETAQATTDRCSCCASGQCAGGWHLVETKSFRVWCPAGWGDPARIAQQCESLRGELHAKWLSGTHDGHWSPRCEVVVHATAAGYARAVGRGGQRTAGSSAVTVKAGKVLARRLDLRADRGDPMAAAPHELTHIVLADRFADRPLPRWADEGMATLADSPAKRAEHRRDLARALNGRGGMRVAELLSMENYPHTTDWATFYGQSVSLVEFLLERGEPDKLLRLVEFAQQVGYDAALSEVYGIAGTSALERQWRAHVTTSRPASGTLAAD
jgi:hypothetical protein